MRFSVHCMTFFFVCYNIMLSDGWLSTFRNNMLPPSYTLKTVTAGFIEDHQPSVC